ncbi:PREDICTED: probable LRR receptor-like serine/threonine-protein kinase At3g47570 [Nelumbo nucifera]|uniref:non-specific serine/threonine protein kinase n=2 Tax=Nelumbo nucifera TaxID=4432 RepID=A0A822ZIR0_NELNU|nr:PREDICTED: probable LRR receptor-like serine/threonine-protein kinase At3g47570 [Nelumbo nucifera]DAD45022.1 TPA_asm: hypothetical protein HUJ06_003252 [Nelumbo nucifera]
MNTVLRPGDVTTATVSVAAAAAGTGTGLGGNETDLLALLAFKSRITQDPLGVMSSWNNSHHHCKWEGVTCARRQPRRVISLALESKGLVGTIPPEIGNLSLLGELWLLNNSFHGEIPRQIGRLLKLEVINFRNNSLEGEIPANLSHCSNLTDIVLAGNRLTGKIPAELGSLLKLEALTIHGNNLAGEIPHSFGNLSSLLRLSAAYNMLEGSIPNLDRLTKLTTLGLGGNKLSGMVPSNLYNLSSLTVFDVGANQLEGTLPPDLGFTLPNIQRFIVAQNHFTGTIPVSLSNASKLEILATKINEFSGKVSVDFKGLPHLWWLSMGSNHLGNMEMDDLNFINTMTNCSNLQVLGFEENRLGGMLPKSVANLSTQLTTLTLGRNFISGSIPSGIENLVNLNVLGLEINELTGTIPTSMGKLQKLYDLTLAINRLAGRIPSSLGNLTSLSTLRLQVNNLTGSIPPSLGNCSKLFLLQLSGNSLSGVIPREIFGISSLTLALDLAQNHLVGSLPQEVGQLRNLEQLDVSENKLSGGIPSSLGSCASLENLVLKGNLFNGSIPSSLSSLRGLINVDLSQNNLSGPIPQYFQQFRSLQSLNLSFNNLEGEVPTDGVFQNASIAFVAGNSKLCGGIPRLQLSPCPTKELKEKSVSRHKRLIIAACSSGAFVCISSVMAFVILYWRRMQRKEEPSSASSILHRHLMISYEALMKATEGFCSANLLGTGSFGSVYKGSLDQGETCVAVKVLNLQQRGASRSFMAECESLRNIRHRNLLKVITSCSSIDFQGNDFKALVYEFMSNGSLEDWLHPKEDCAQVEPRKHLSILQRLNIAIDVASALDYIHHHCEIPIIHCDLKPSNVLLDENLTAHVGDFGLSRFLLEAGSRSSSSQASSVGIKGTIGYSAPEYGMGAEVSTQGDVYSYGILLLEMFIGKRPTDEMFRGDLNLHSLAKMALPERAMEIIDPMLFSGERAEVEEVANNIESERCKRERMQECVVSIIRVGVACSMELPKQRMNITDALNELQKVRKYFLEISTQRQRHR